MVVHIAASQARASVFIYASRSVTALPRDRHWRSVRLPPRPIQAMAHRPRLSYASYRPTFSRVRSKVVLSGLAQTGPDERFLFQNIGVAHRVLVREVFCIAG
jgi:hypothetical protein